LTGFNVPIAQVMYIDRKLTDHTLLQAIARVNRTSKNKSRGYIVDYFGLSDYLTEALEMFSSDDIEGALRDLKDEIPELESTHKRVIQHFKGMDFDDLDTCILSLEDEPKRKMFQLDFQKFSQQMDVVLPDPAAVPFKADLRKLGKISHGAKNRFRDEQLSIAGAGEKVRKLIEDHIFSTGVDPKIPPIDLLAADFKEKLNEHKSDRSKASEIENAIKHHIKVNLDDDPEYYKSLSEQLESIIQAHEGKWEEQRQLMFNLRDGIEPDRKKYADDLGLSGTELPFYNILVSELGGKEPLSPDSEAQYKEVIQSLVLMLDEASKIVDFWSKQDEQKRVKQIIKHKVIENFDESYVKRITEKFMNLAERKFK